MSGSRKSPLFIAALTACAVVALGEAGLIYQQWAESRASARAQVQKVADLQAMAGLNPPPTREVANAIDADLARARRILGAMQAELKGRGPAAERMAKAKVPAARTDAFFDLATFVEKTRDLARKNEVDIRPEAARLGFAMYANEGPEVERIEAVFHQRQIAQYLIEALIDARPQTVLSVKRERPLTKKELEDRAAAAAAIAAGNPPPEPSPDAVAASSEDSPDYFVLDPRMSVRAPGFVDSTAFQLTFAGQTAALRAFLNRLASFELPVLVREVAVEPATAEESTPTAPSLDDAAAVAPDPAAAAASVVLSPASPPPAPKKIAPRAASVAPIVARPFSKFTVTVEFIELVPPAASGT